MSEDGKLPFCGTGNALKTNSYAALITRYEVIGRDLIDSESGRMQSSVSFSVALPQFREPSTLAMPIPAG